MADLYRLESEHWQTASLLLVEGAESVAVDPGVSPAEIERVRARADELGAPVRTVLATHSHFDHVCGIGAFPDAEAVMGDTTAVTIADGSAAEGLANASRRYGFEYTGKLRCDRSLALGCAHRIGPFDVETLAITGHSTCGAAFRVRSLDLLIVGDHLSAAEIPFVESTAAYRASLAALIDLLRRDPPAVVAPGHGPLLEPGRALAIAEQDLEYLHDLRRAVAAALGADDDAFAAGLAVETPRPSWPDLAEELDGNVRAQIAELVSGQPG